MALVVEVDADNEAKDIDSLDIEIPVLSRRFNREYRELDALDPAQLSNPRLRLKPFARDETREIVFTTMLDADVHHTVHLDDAGPADYRSVVGFFARQLLKELRLVGGYDQLYAKVKAFVREHLFEASPVNLEDPMVLRNLAEPEAGKILFDAFKKGINALTLHDAGAARIEGYLRLRDTRPFRTENRSFVVPRKSVFNKIVGEPRAGGFELKFAASLEEAADVTAFAKNYLAVGFKLDYVRADGSLSTYVPDFLVRTEDGTLWVVETKGKDELDEAKQKGIDLAPRYIPAEVFDKRAVEKNQVVFHDVSFVEATPRYDKKDKLTMRVELTDFSVYYTQGVVDAAIEALKNGKSQVICEQGRLIKISKDRDGVVTRDVLTKHWTDWVDYWVVDFDYTSRKEIIRVARGMGVESALTGFEPAQGELPDFEERWTGGYIFENEWQSFRTRRERELELISAPHTYSKPGRYTVAVKVIDIFGNDTMVLVPVSVG